ncbi:MAG: hypothetical protein K9L28_05860 [Synergistales bacterium]|nr:hypothetical protein [Synergistales bacterium]
MKLEKDGVAVWVPRDLRFSENTVRINAKGFLWNTILVADTALISGPRGGCA